MKSILITTCFAVLVVSAALAQGKKTVPPPPKPEDKASGAAATAQVADNRTAPAMAINIQQAIFTTKEGKQRFEDLSHGGTQADFQARQGAIGNEILTKMAPMIVKYANDHGYGLILDTSQQWPKGPVIWYGPSVDITKAIVEVYDARSECNALDQAVKIEDAMPSGPGHCTGEADFWFTNISAQAIDCALIFHKNGRFDPASVLTFTLSPGEKSGGTGKISTCGADSGQMQYQCFTHAENAGANSCTAQIQWQP
jgi:hypothetical protein